MSELLQSTSHLPGCRCDGHDDQPESSDKAIPKIIYLKLESIDNKLAQLIAKIDEELGADEEDEEFIDDDLAETESDEEVKPPPQKKKKTLTKSPGQLKPFGYYRPNQTGGQYPSFGFRQSPFAARWTPYNSWQKK